MADKPPDKGPTGAAGIFQDPALQETLAQFAKRFEGLNSKGLQDPEAAPTRKPAAHLPNTTEPKGEVAGGDKAAPRKPRRRKESGFDRRPGRREMKEYPLTWQEVVTLGAVQGSSALLFAIAGTLLGVWFNVGQSLAFAPDDADRAIIGYYEGVRDVALVGSILFAIAALVLFGISGWAVWKIRSNTRHD